MKGKRAGTVDECFKKGQVRYWGLNKLDDGYIDALLADREYERKLKRKKPKTVKRNYSTLMILPKAEKIDTDDSRGKKLTEEEITDRIDKFISGKKDTKIMKKINEFMNRFNDKKDGSKLKRNGFEVKKLNNFEYQLTYKGKDHFGKPVMSNFITDSKSNISNYLYMDEVGIIVWYDGIPINITNITKHYRPDKNPRHRHKSKNDRIIEFWNKVKRGEIEIEEVE